jgi:hypothetical protein
VLHGGELLAAAAFALVLIGGIAWSRGAPRLVIGTFWALSAATSVLAAWRIVPTVVRIRRLGKRQQRGR